jgi:hypothetical protein
MLTKDQKKELNVNFWGTFKNFSRRYKSSNGKRINWVNYPSDVQDVFIRLHADSTHAKVTFDIQTRDAGVRSLLWEQMLELKKVMEEHMTIKPLWYEHQCQPDGRIISRIEWRKEHVNYLIEEDHQAIYQFFMAVLVPFDIFYQEFKEILVNLTD